MLSSAALLSRPDSLPPPPEDKTLFATAGLPLPQGGCGALRLMNKSWTGSCVRVRRASNNAEIDVGFVNGVVDAAAIATHCSGTTGWITRWYDQSGQGHDIIYLLPAQQPRIYNAGAMEMDDGKYAARLIDGARGGLSNPFPAHTGQAVTGSIVGSFSAASTAFSPRYLSLLPADQALGDDNVAGAILLARKQQTTEWGTNRAGTFVNSSPGAANRLNSVVSKIDGAVSTIVVDGLVETEQITAAPFNAGRLALGNSGFGNVSATDSYICEWIFWFIALTAAQITLLQTNQRAYYGTSSITAPPPPPPPATFDPAQQGFTLRAREDFTGGTWRQQDWTVYSNGKSTSRASAWKAENVRTVLLTDGPYAGQYALEFLSKKNAAVQSYSDGFTYLREGGAAFWRGPNGAAFQKEGLWRATYRWVGKNGTPATPSRGHGFVDLMWPAEGSGSGNRGWPINGEPDVMEVFPGNTNKQGGESNWHLDSVSNSGRAQKQPPSSGTVSQYPNLFSGLPSADVSRGNYGIDFLQWHTVDFLMRVGQYYEVYVDGVFHGRVKFTASNPSPYVISAAVSLIMRRTFQIEHYTIDDASSAAGTFALQVKEVEYWSLP